MSAFRFADLHVHTTHSDGSDTPAEVVQKAAESGISCLAVTDHDTCSGLEEAAAASVKHGVELIAGIEISTYIGAKSVHILGYLMDINSDLIKKIVTGARSCRLERMERMVSRLNDLGYDINLDETLEFIGEATVGRALLARYLVHKGFFSSVGGVFDTILGDGNTVYEPVKMFSPEAAIKLVAGAGGVTSLAHPGYTGIDDEIPRLAAAGLDGIEVFSSQHYRDAERRYLELAERFDMLVTGGSDCHGAKMPSRNIGDVKLSYDYIEKLKKRAAKVAAMAA